MKKLYKFVAGVGKVEVSEEEIRASEANDNQDISTPTNTDKVQTLIEGLSNATTLAQIRKIAKDILESASEGEAK